MNELTHDIDQTVWRVAGEMTTVDADGFGRRVRARLHQTAAARRMWQLALGATVVMAAIGLTMVWLEGSMPRVENLPAIQASLPAAPPALLPAIGVLPFATTSRRDSVRRKRNVQTLSPSELEWLSRAVPALDAPEAVEFLDIEPARLELPPITLEPIGRR